VSIVLALVKKTLPAEFRPFYQYVVRDGQPRDQTVLDKKLWNKPGGAVYARVVDAEPVYIGSTHKPLCRRLAYQVANRDTPGRYAEFRHWAEGKLVTMYAYHPEPTVRLGRRVPVHNGLEQVLNEELKPRFGKRKC
jgi:hypothetical protein